MGLAKVVWFMFEPFSKWLAVISKVFDIQLCGKCHSFLFSCRQTDLSAMFFTHIIEFVM